MGAGEGGRAAGAMAAEAGLWDLPRGTLTVTGDDAMRPAARDWLRSLVAAGGMDVMVCQCEEVSRQQLLDISPPTYLGAGNMRGNGGIAALSPANRGSQDLLKRMTRAGMGHCQGKRCRDQVLMLLADATGRDLAELVPGTYRAPVRPIPLSVLWAGEETEEMRRTWPIWLHPVEEGAPGYASARSMAQPIETARSRDGDDGEG